MNSHRELLERAARGEISAISPQLARSRLFLIEKARESADHDIKKRREALRKRLKG